jgi:hypothetical protein
LNILLLGNGFDLHHKFPTAYIDFLHTIKFLVEHYDESTMKTVADVFGDDRLKSKCKNIETSFAEYEYFYKETSLDADKVKEIIEKAKNNLWFKYFSTAAEKELTWIDFEKEISEVVEAFREFFDKAGMKFAFENYTKNEKSKFIIRRFGFFVIRLSNVILAGAGPAYTIKPEYKKETPIGSEIYEIDKDKIISELYCSLRELTDLLKAYLKLFIDGVILEMEDLQFTIKNASYPQLGYVFTFNYTNTVEKLYTTEDVVFHIHGNVDENIVLGVNPDKYDEFEEMDTSFIRFKKYFQRVFYRADIGYMKAVDEVVGSLKSAPSYAKDITVYVIGHSLDETDKDVIQEIFGLATKIKIFYHKDEVVGDYIKNLINIYGKSGFDSLRTRKDIEFVPHEPSELYHS